MSVGGSIHFLRYEADRARDQPTLLLIAVIGHEKSLPSANTPILGARVQPKTLSSININSRLTKKRVEASVDPQIETVRLDRCSKTMSFVGAVIDTVEL